MKNTIKIVGPCSKWIDGEGWVTQVPIHLIENAGFVKKEEKVKSFWQGRTIEKRTKQENKL